MRIRKTATSDNGDEYTPGRCCECRAGQHEDYDDEIELCVVIDPDTKKIYRRGYLCEGHRNMFLEDGYTVTEKKKKPVQKIKAAPVKQSIQEIQSSLTRELIAAGFSPVTCSHCSGAGCFLCQDVGIIWEKPGTHQGPIVVYKNGFLTEWIRGPNTDKQEA